MFYYLIITLGAGVGSGSRSCDAKGWQNKPGGGRNAQRNHCSTRQLFIFQQYPVRSRMRRTTHIESRRIFEARIFTLELSIDIS